MDGARIDDALDAPDPRAALTELVLAAECAAAPAAAAQPAPAPPELPATSSDDDSDGSGGTPPLEAWATVEGSDDEQLPTAPPRSPAPTARWAAAAAAPLSAQASPVQAMLAQRKQRRLAERRAAEQVRINRHRQR